MGASCSLGLSRGGVLGGCFDGATFSTVFRARFLSIRLFRLMLLLLLRLVARLLQTTLYTCRHFTELLLIVSLLLLERAQKTGQKRHFLLLHRCLGVGALGRRAF